MNRQQRRAAEREQRKAAARGSAPSAAGRSSGRTGTPTAGRQPPLDLGLLKVISDLQPLTANEVNKEVARRGRRSRGRSVSDEIAPFDSLHVVACAFAHFNITPEGAYSEATQEPGTTVEYLASIALERPDNEVSGEPADLQAFNDAVIGKAWPGERGR
jgi:hypothetical protein